MSLTIDRVRGWFPPGLREKAYNIAGTAVVALGAWGVIHDSSVAAYSQLAVATVTLLFAILYSTDNLRTALYSTLLAVQGAALVYSVGSNESWAAILSIAAAVLGTQTASGRTPAPYDVPGVPGNSGT